MQTLFFARNNSGSVPLKRYCHGQRKRDNKNMNQNAQTAQFLSMQVLKRGLNTVTKLGNVALQMYQERAIN